MTFKFMFDTNIFDSVLDEKVDINKFPNNYEFFVTHIQKDEIEAIDKPEKQDKKKKLLGLFKELNQEKMSTESAVWGVSKWGESKWTSENNLIEELRKGNLKHTEDALIGETAIKNNLILVTNNTNDLLRRVKALGGKAITFEQFKNGEFE